MVLQYTKIDILEILEAFSQMLILAKVDVDDAHGAKWIQEAYDRSEQVYDRLTNANVITKAMINSYFGPNGVTAETIARLMEQLHPGSTKSFKLGIYMVNSYYHQVVAALNLVSSRSKNHHNAHTQALQMFEKKEENYRKLYKPCKEFFQEFYSHGISCSKLIEKRCRANEDYDEDQDNHPSSSKKRITNSGKIVSPQPIKLVNNNNNMNDDDDIEEIVIDDDYDMK